VKRKKGKEVPFLRRDGGVADTRDKDEGKRRDSAEMNVRMC
jgi:hypothetical protein